MSMPTRAALSLFLLTGVLAGCGGGSSDGTSNSPPPSTPPPVNTAPPTASIASIAPAHRLTHQPITFTGSGTTPVVNGVLSYSWNFGDGSSGTGANTTHQYTARGTYTVTLTVTDPGNLSTSVSEDVTVLDPLLAPNLYFLHGDHLLGQTLFAQVAFQEPNGLPYVLDWTLGDGATAQTTDLKPVTHTYGSPGSYTVSVTATNSAGLTSTVARTISVQPLSDLPAAIDNVFTAYCAGAFCGAASPTRYSGEGVGIWRYHNATAVDASIDIEISGVVPQSPATLVFSNGKANAAASVPGAGTVASGSGKATHAKSAVQSPYDGHHWRMTEANRQIALALTRRAAARRALSPSFKSSGEFTNAGTHAATPIGTTRSWNEFFITGETSTVVLRASCQFSTGRNGLIWVDADAYERGEIDPERITLLAQTLCGPSGAYELLVAMHGDVWGPAPTQFVQDGESLQDLHIVIPAVAQSTGFGGYFAASNLNHPSVDPGSNAAISVVLNGWVFANYPIEDAAIRNTLIHELKHLINFYQRTIVRGATHAAWLEETSAMLAEDLVSPRASPWSRTEARVSGYVSSGGGIGYLAWTHPEGNSYNQGGSFGTFLHRRYGASLDRELVSACADDGSPVSSYQCVQDYIVRHGGLGFEDEFSRMGASALGSMPSSAAPRGFGFPGQTLEGSLLVPVSAQRSSVVQDDPPRDLGGTFGATTHTYSREYVAAGQTTYQRNDVLVPAGTTLLLVIAEPAD